MYLFCLLGAVSNLFANASYRARSSASSSIGDDDDDDDASPVPSPLDAANPRVAANTRERPPTAEPGARDTDTDDVVRCKVKHADDVAVRRRRRLTREASRRTRE
jgi:hypothetical protein